jgi:hypothetical protein
VLPHLFTLRLVLYGNWDLFRKKILFKVSQRCELL